jgi:hypothetical protein
VLVRLLVHPIEVDLTGERHEGRPVQERVRDSRHEIGCPRAQRSQTDTGSAREPAVHVGDEGSSLLVTYGNELDRRAVERLAEIERLLAGNPEDEADSLRLETPDQHIGHARHVSIIPPPRPSRGLARHGRGPAPFGRRA